MIIPKNLEKGDKIGIISTARKISKKEIKTAIDLFSSWGLDVKLGKYLFEEKDQFAGTSKQRAKDFQSMLEDKEIKAIVCARGGYGTLKIIDKIDFKTILKNPKWIVGYSDATVLHSHLNKLKVASIHATMPINFSKNTKPAIATFKKALFGENYIIEAKSCEQNKKGEAAGELVGGNLSILYALQGSISDIDTENKILFIEDLDEYLYHIDRMITSLKRAKKLDKLAGLIVGSMKDMHDNNIPYGATANEIIYNAVKEFNYPICFNFPSGHINNNNTLMLGLKADLKVGKETLLSFKKEK